MHVLSTLTTLLTLTTTALSLPKHDPTDPDDGPHKPKTTAWPDHNPAYSGVFASVRPDLALTFHRYHGQNCTHASHLARTDNIHSPHCKTFSHPFGAYNYELHKISRSNPPKTNIYKALALCQVAVFKETHCKGDAYIASPGTVNASLGGTNAWDWGGRVKAGDGFCGVADGADNGGWGHGDVGRSVKVMCVRNSKELLPEGIVRGVFGETPASGDEGG